MKKSERQEPGNFLKSRRARVSPEDVGIIAYGRRRTSGLKREEVAQLAGVSLTWYTWIEQGRDINFSVDVLNSVLRALQLSPHERRYAFELCGFQFDSDSSNQDIAPSLRQLVDHQNPYPAYILGRYWHVLHINQSASELFCGFDELPAQRRNIIWYTFACDEARTLVHEWEIRARRIIAEFRADCRAYLTDRWLIELIDDLRKVSSEFDMWWEQHDVQFREEKQKIFHHPTRGILTFNQHTLKVSANSDVKLIVHVPTNTD